MGIAEQVTKGFEDLKGFFTGRESTAEIETKRINGLLGAANDRIVLLEAQVKEKDIAIGTLRGEVEVADKAKVDAETKLKDGEASLDRRANQRALSIEQQRGASAPAKDEEKEGQSSGKTKLEEYGAISDPKARAEFYTQNRDAILSGK